METSRGVAKRASRRCVCGLGRGVACLLFLLGGSSGCAKAPYFLCAGERECGPAGACVAGRCLRRGAVPAIEGARRWEIEPGEISCVRETEPRVGDSATTVTLGRRDGEAIVLLRFSVPVPPDSDLLEAYVLLDCPGDFEPDPVPISLHVERIASPWTAASVSWVGRPRLEDVGTPWTRVAPQGGHTVRIDVRGLVAGGKRGARDDVAIDLAIRALGSSHSGMAFTLRSGEHGRGPRLELYAK